MTNAYGYSMTTWIGWSVLARGIAECVIDHDKEWRLIQLPLQPWGSSQVAQRSALNWSIPLVQESQTHVVRWSGGQVVSTNEPRTSPLCSRDSAVFASRRSIVS